MDYLNREAGICPFCEAKVEPHWVMCDECGKRLPWAPAKGQRDINELSDEELAALCGTATAPLPKRSGVHALRDILMRAVRKGFH